jgi:hypothetical protein
MAATRQMLMSAFFKHATDMLDKLQGMFPDEDDIGMYKQSLRLLGSSAATAVPFMRKFYAYTSPYEAALAARDESFFMRLEYGGSEGGNEGTMMKAIRLKELVKTMSAASKESLFQYFDGLVRICAKLNDHDAATLKGGV